MYIMDIKNQEYNEHYIYWRLCICRDTTTRYIKLII